jgi:hypothetical protein
MNDMDHPEQAPDEMTPDEAYEAWVIDHQSPDYHG